ncbi:MAG: cytochrome C, partial [Nitrospirae bacterium]|nr:cytochrome C [Nitrospirota bacterium]
MKDFNKIILFLLSILYLFLTSNNCYALPSFARQTGMSCNDCHTVFPALTPAGRDFKLGGYTQSKSNTLYETLPPIAAGVALGYTVSKGLTNGIAPYNAANRGTDALDLPSGVALYYAGRVYGPVGAWIEVDYDGIGNAFSLGMLDIRIAETTKISDKPFTYGITINNMPTMEDPWNSSAMWGFPYLTSPVASASTISSMIDGGFMGQLGGFGAYGYWNDTIYLALSVYRTTLNGITEPFGAGMTTTTVVSGAVPYWRLAINQKFDKDQTFMIGTYGTVASIYPLGASSGATDMYTDIAVDTQYQYISDPHIITLMATWIHETQSLDATFRAGGASNNSDNLNTF